MNVRGCQVAYFAFWLLYLQVSDYSKLSSSTGDVAAKCAGLTDSYLNGTCQCDIIMLIDTSCSITPDNFGQVQAFMMSVIDSTSNNRIGFVWFDNFTGVVDMANNYNAADKMSLKGSAANIIKCQMKNPVTLVTRSGCCQTHTYDGLDLARLVNCLSLSVCRLCVQNCSQAVCIRVYLGNVGLREKKALPQWVFLSLRGFCWLIF